MAPLEKPLEVLLARLALLLRARADPLAQRLELLLLPVQQLALRAKRRSIMVAGIDTNPRFGGQPQRPWVGRCGLRGQDDSRNGALARESCVSVDVFAVNTLQPRRTPRSRLRGK